MNKSKFPKVVCVGGGTGTFVTLKGLKKFRVDLTAIVTMSDSGGSNKRIRDEFGLLPTSDIRQCLVALSDEYGGVELLRKLFMYRYEKGEGISGMTFGNLFMAALSDILGSQKEAIKQTGRVLRIHGTVMPVSYTHTDLIAEYEDGNVVNEEHLIDEPVDDGRKKIRRVWLKPEADANPDALKAIETADMIVLCPGDLFTSLIPNLLVNNISKAIKSSKAKLVYIQNLMTKYGQTYNFKSSDHINELEKYIGKRIDYVLINNGKIPKKALELYSETFEYQVEDDLNETTYFKIIRENYVKPVLTNRSQSDKLVRSLIRHDSLKIGSKLMEILGN